MRVTSKGQVTIPIEIRQALGINQETEVEFELLGNVIQVRKAPDTGRARHVVDRLVGAGWSGPSTEELLALTRGEE